MMGLVRQRKAFSNTKPKIFFPGFSYAQLHSQIIVPEKLLLTQLAGGNHNTIIQYLIEINTA